MMTIPAVFDMLFFYRNKTMASKLALERLLHIELTATHKEMAAWIGTDKAAFVIEEAGATHGTKLPPVFLLFFLFCRF
jgi:hypothetical protein